MAGIERAARELPGGVVTFVFTDIEGSTALFRALGDAYPPLLDAHNEILRQVWDEYRGVEVKTEGDAFFVAFADPTDAIRASVEAIERLGAHPWPADALIKVRIGMHTGVGHPRDGDYIAFPVHQAARIGGVGHGGQVVVSPETVELAGDLGDIELHDLGSYRVRDFDDAIHLFQAERNATATPFAELRTARDVRHNVPVDLPFAHGREADLAGIAEQLDQGRLVSIVGPGGVGKTLTAKTLALQTAAEYSDGAWFVDLSSHDDGSTLGGAVADALGCTAEELDDYLGERTMLLVLDNAEQATAEIARLVSRLLGLAPGLSVLVTSREPLAISAERVWRLNLMDETVAIELFVERARSADPGFDPEGQGESIAELCRRLDGLPLAIELAAARVTALSVAEIIDSLENRLRVLRSRRRDLDDRQRTATGLVDWSYQLLDEDEQLVFRRLGVFAAGFELDGATVACEDAGLDRIDVSDILWSLVEKSLVMPVIGDGTTRYRLLETLRAFAHHALAETDELISTQQQVGNWYRVRFDPTAPFTRLTSAAMREELDSVRTLAGDIAEADPSLGQWLTWAIGLYYKNTDPARGSEELAPLLERLVVPGEAVVGMIAVAAHLAFNCGDLDASNDLLERAEPFIGDERPIGVGWIHNVRALNSVRAGELDAAAAILESAQAGASPLELISIVNSLGIVQAESGDLVAALASFENLLARSHDVGALDAEAVATGAVAEISHRAGDMRRAIETTAAAVELSGQSGMRSQHAMALVGAARLMADTGDHLEAVMLHAGADRILVETGQQLFPGDKVLSEQMYASAQAALADQAFESAVALGNSLADLELHERAAAALEAALSQQPDQAVTAAT